jgi:hypothetical protein
MLDRHQRHHLFLAMLNERIFLKKGESAGAERML